MTDEVCWLNIGGQFLNNFFSSMNVFNVTLFVVVWIDEFGHLCEDVSEDHILHTQNCIKMFHSLKDTLGEIRDF